MSGSYLGGRYWGPPTVMGFNLIWLASKYLLLEIHKTFLEIRREPPTSFLSIPWQPSCQWLTDWWHASLLYHVSSPKHCPRTHPLPYIRSQTLAIPTGCTQIRTRQGSADQDGSRNVPHRYCHKPVSDFSSITRPPRELSSRFQWTSIKHAGTASIRLYSIYFCTSSTVMLGVKCPVWSLSFS